MNLLNNNNNNKYDFEEKNILTRKFCLHDYNIEINNNNSIDREETLFKSNKRVKSLKYYENLIFNSLMETKHYLKTNIILTDFNHTTETNVKLCQNSIQIKKKSMLRNDEAELYFRHLNKNSSNLVLLVYNSCLFVDQTILCLASERLRYEINSLKKSLNSNRITFEILEYKYENILQTLKFIYPQFSLKIDCKSFFSTF
jgi:hypothetical protein